MLKIGITEHGIGGGKTTVSKIFEILEYLCLFMLTMQPKM